MGRALVWAVWAGAVALAGCRAGGAVSEKALKKIVEAK